MFFNFYFVNDYDTRNSFDYDWDSLDGGDWADFFTDRTEVEKSTYDDTCHLNSVDLYYVP